MNTTGTLRAGSGARLITTTDGHLDGAQINPRSMAYEGLSSLAWSGTGASNTLTTVASGSYVNSSGVMMTIAAGTTQALTPSASGNQWQVIWFNDAGAANVTLGTVGGARTTAAIPTASAFMARWVFVAQNSVGI